MKMREVAIIGVGLHKWGKFPQKSWVQMGVEATVMALQDAGVKWTDIQTVACGSMPWAGSLGLRAGNVLAEVLGETGVPIVNVQNACATGGSVLRTAHLMVATEVCDLALAVAVDKSPTGFFPSLAVLSEEPSPPVDIIRWSVGLPNPGYWALECKKRMERYGTTEVQLAKVKVKNSKNGSTNPNARYRKAFTLEEVLLSPMVCDPLRLYEICATSDGAAAVVLCSTDMAKKLSSNKPIKIAACSLSSGEYGDPTIRIPLLSTTARPTAPILSESALAAKRAFEQAGLGPEDVDFVELPDNSSWHELQYLETMGFCKEGESERLLDSGETEIGGRLPVCPSGGFSSFGEATTAQGLLQIHEAVLQLRGQAGARQVKDAKVAMCQVYGAQGNNSAAILKV